MSKRECCSDPGHESELDHDTEHTSDVQLEKKTLEELLLDKIHSVVNIDCPDWYIDPGFEIVLAERDKLNSVALACPLRFPPEVEELLNSANAPMHTHFFALPSPQKGTWCVYIIIFETPGRQLKLYIGLGTSESVGMLGRTQQYHPDNYATLPRFVRLAFEEGFTISHIGTLCYTPVPRPGIRPRSRGLVKAAEAVFSVEFNAIIPHPTTDHFVKHLMR